MSTNIEQVAGALAEFDRVSAGIAALTDQYGGVVYDVATTEGMEAARAARRAIREPRYEVEKVRKGAKAPLLALGRQIDDEAKRITAELLKIESPIDQQITVEEDRREAERQAKIRAEQERVEKIQARIANIRALATSAAAFGSEKIERQLQSLAMVVVDDSFAEFKDEAMRALDESGATLRRLHEAATAREAEQARLAAERAELERLRAEQAAREKAEQDRLAEERRKLEAERQKHAEEIAALSRKIEGEAAVAVVTGVTPATPAPPPAVNEPRQPKPSEIIDLIANHYGVERPVAIRWLRGMFGVRDAA